MKSPAFHGDFTRGAHVPLCDDFMVALGHGDAPKDWLDIADITWRHAGLDCCLGIRICSSGQCSVTDISRPLSVHGRARHGYARWNVVASLRNGSDVSAWIAGIRP
jgi:hypothetical protein